jgi:hypothetical protein
MITDHGTQRMDRRERERRPIEGEGLLWFLRGEL